MEHEYNDAILCIVSGPCSHALAKVARRAALHKLEARYGFGKLLQRDTEYYSTYCIFAI